MYSDNYAGGSLGSLNSFPFMELSGDEGVGAIGGNNRETMTIAKLDDIEELHILRSQLYRCHQRYVQGIRRTMTPVSRWKPTGTRSTPSRSTRRVRVRLPRCASSSPVFMGAELSNDSSVMSLEEFRASVPGAEALKLLSKVTLQKKGDSAHPSAENRRAPATRSPST